MKVYCFGDSNTYGYDARMLLDNRYPPEYRWVDILADKTGWTMINKGFNGREIPRKGIHVPDDVDLFIVMLGTNDLLQGNSVDDVAERMALFLTETRFPAEKTLHGNITKKLASLRFWAAVRFIFLWMHSGIRR